MERMNNKITAVMIIFIIAALSPWLWLSQTFGMGNIPHDDLVMWIFMELYCIIAGLVFLGIVLIGISMDGDEEKPKRKRKNGNGKKRISAAREKRSLETVKKVPTKKPSKPKKNTENGEGSYSDEEMQLPAENGGSVEYPAEWDEELFE